MTKENENKFVSILYVLKHWNDPLPREWETEYQFIITVWWDIVFADYITKYMYKVTGNIFLLKISFLNLFLLFSLLKWGAALDFALLIFWESQNKGGNKIFERKETVWRRHLVVTLLCLWSLSCYGWLGASGWLPTSVGVSWRIPLVYKW